VISIGMTGHEDLTSYQSNSARDRLVFQLRMTKSGFSVLYENPSHLPADCQKQSTRRPRFSVLDAPAACPLTHPQSNQDPGSAPLFEKGARILDMKIRCHRLIRRCLVGNPSAKLTLDVSSVVFGKINEWTDTLLISALVPMETRVGS
jgi:hypothetical protein